MQEPFQTSFLDPLSLNLLFVIESNNTFFQRTAPGMQRYAVIWNRLMIREARTELVSQQYVGTNT